MRKILLSKEQLAEAVTMYLTKHFPEHAKKTAELLYVVDAGAKNEIYAEVRFPE